MRDWTAVHDVSSFIHTSNSHRTTLFLLFLHFVVVVMNSIRLVICGGGGRDDDGTLGYCWNSQTPQCPPACDNVQGVSGIGNNQCGGPCDGFLNYRNAMGYWCHAMGYYWKPDYVGDDDVVGSCVL